MTDVNSQKHFRNLISAAAITDYHRHSGTDRRWENTVLPPALLDETTAEIAAWEAYEPTALTALPAMATAFGIGALAYKDESTRFGLGSFKSLGGAFAVLKLVSEKLGVPMRDIRAGKHRQAAAEITVTTATDGNHGRSVAWGCQQAGCPCFIYIHSEVSEGRAQAMRAYGAVVTRIDGDYDQSVRRCAEEARTKGRFMVSDTSYPGYEDVPRNVMAGYAVMAREVLAQTGEAFTHVILQAGVGGMAAGFIAGYMKYLPAKNKTAGTAPPRFLIAESELAPCLIASLRAGDSVPVPVTQETLMAGLSCGEPSMLALRILTAHADTYVTVPDAGVATAMRLMAGQNIRAGECSVTGLLVLAGLKKNAAQWEEAGLGPSSRVLIIGTEGATDEAIYASVLNSDRI